jgi:hypothetical protein
MVLLMALRTQRHEIHCGIIALQAARSNVMDLQIGARTTVLAAPSISLQYVATQFLVRIRIEPKPRPLGSQ